MDIQSQQYHKWYLWHVMEKLKNYSDVETWVQLPALHTEHLQVSLHKPVSSVYVLWDTKIWHATKQFSTMQCYQQRQCDTVWYKHMRQYHILVCQDQLPVYAKCKNCNQKHTLFCHLLTKLSCDNCKHVKLFVHPSISVHSFNKQMALPITKTANFVNILQLQEQVTKCKSVNTQHCHKSS
jgi:hypothetical protein